MQNVIKKGNKVTIRTIEESNIKTLWSLVFKEENPEWKKWDAPYFPFSMQEYAPYKENSLLTFNLTIFQEEFIFEQVQGMYQRFQEDMKRNARR